MNFTNAFTVDVEEHFQVSAFEATVHRDQWSGLPSRVVANTKRLLALLDRHAVKGTFFVLGWTAKRHPALVQDIEAAGHEIASHGFWHRIVYGQSPDEFREDIRLGRDVLQDIVGHRVIAYRAPSFSITRRSLWAREILVEEGFEVDSSVFPVHHDRYGIPDAPLEIHRIETPSGPLWEFPPSVACLGGMRLPVGGGGYFRLYPLSVTTVLLRRIHRLERRPFMFYIHPWEVDPEQPRIAVKSRISRFRHYCNLSSTEAKLSALLDQFRFAPMGEVLRTFQKSADGSRQSSNQNFPVNSVV
jgi:polysaccharide deacetylase family protein (PEP-CTERM system associated)